MKLLSSNKFLLDFVGYFFLRKQKKLEIDHAARVPRTNVLNSSARAMRGAPRRGLKIFSRATRSDVTPLIFSGLLL